MKNNTKQPLSLLLNKHFGFLKLLLLVFVFNVNAFAQIQSPDLYCIKNDTLFWNLPNNNCGPFISYQIFVSKNINGPYALLADITNPTQTKYFDSNVNGMTLYYYMLSNFNCPGQSQISSDTLDNLIPPLIPIESVTVVNGKTIVTWQANTTEQLAYIVYKNTPAGTVPIDTVFSGNSYIDQNSGPGNRSEIYYILSMDLCGNTSIFDKAHYSIFLTNPKDSCSSAVKLNWSPYQNWPNVIQ